VEKLTEVLALAAELQQHGVFCALVYLHEAHADDVWPLGFGVANPTTLAERWARLDALATRADLAQLDAICCDGMDNAFLRSHGAWPERYFLVEDQQVVWSNDLWNGAMLDVLEEVRCAAQGRAWC